MLDFVLGLGLAALLVRGWARGFVREAFGLVGLVLGTWIAFALSPIVGDFLAQSFGVTPEVARVGGGVALFVLLSAGLSVGAYLLTKMMSLPGLTTLNRVGGAAVAVGWGVAILLVVFNVVRVLPLSPAWEERIADSVVVDAIAGPEALPQQVFLAVAGDTALVALQEIQALFGESRVVPSGDEVVQIPPAPADEVRQAREETPAVVDEVNRFRAGAGVGALVESEALVQLAEQSSAEAYQTGQLGRDLDCVPEAVDRGLRLVVCTELVALAGTSLAALDGILDSDEGKSLTADPEFGRIGVSVAHGPTGQLLVVVLGG
jgi:uncharacterized membrane protein required for colicin V production/uncharacterized protein YkwD